MTLGMLRGTWLFTLFPFFISLALAKPMADTLHISGTEFEIRVENVQCRESEAVELESEINKEYSSTGLPIHTQKSVILRKYIKYTGAESLEIIVEPGGFQYVDVHLTNLNSRDVVVKKTGRLVPFPANELFEYKTGVNKVKLILEPSVLYELMILYPNPNGENMDLKIKITDFPSWHNKMASGDFLFTFWQGLFFGTVILLSIINFIFYYLFKDKTYIVYVGYIITIAIYELLILGYLNQTFIKYLPSLVYLLSNLALLLSIIFYLLFLREFIDLKNNYPGWYKIFYRLIVMVIVIAIISSFLLYLEYLSTATQIRNIGLFLIMPVAFTFYYKVVQSKRIADRIFLLGSLALLISGLISILFFFAGKFNESDIYLQTGVLMELVIFNIGLGLRSKAIQHEKDNALHMMIGKLRTSEEEQKNLNILLEEKVTARTEEINKINLELMIQRDKLSSQNELIEQSLRQLNLVKDNLEVTVDQKTLELRQANKELIAQNAQLEQYTFITAHNLKAPVARLKGLVNIFELTNEPNGPNKEIVDRLKEASIDMDEVIADINKILQIKNFSQQDRVEADLEAIIRKILKRLEYRIKENGTTIITKITISSIKTIEIYLESILYNLIYNAIKYRRSDVESAVKIRAFRWRKNIVIEIKDNGVGIDMAQFGDKIFGLYQRFHTHIGGKGIGLYLVKTQVEALDGKIRVESKVDEGTTFRLTFPN